MNQLAPNIEQIDLVENRIKEIMTDVYLRFHTENKSSKEWMSIKEACEYIGVAYNTFAKYRVMGLKVSEIEGVKRVSKSEIDNFLNRFSY